jgi:hypothetical protein
MALIWRPFHRALQTAVLPASEADPSQEKSVRSHRASSGGPAHGLDMTHTFMRSSHIARVWVFAWSAIIASAIGCSSEQSAGPTSVAAGDSVAKTVPITDSVATLDSLAVSSALPSAAIKGVPFGPYNIMNSFTTWAWGPAPFTVSLNGNTGPSGVIPQILSARAKGQKLMLSLTDGPRRLQITNGKFDMVKWKLRMDGYNTPQIRAAIAQGIADGTIIGNATINEPKHAEWGGVINKAVLDQMCGYVKKIFPTLPSGPITVHWWLRTETYRTCDFIIDQYDWAQPPQGWGTPGGKGDVVAWRDAALAQGKKERITIAFAMNVLGGGSEVPGCPLSSTGGPYSATDKRHCRMTAAQVRDFGRALGPSGCAMLMWMYENTFWSKSANVQAFKDVAATLAVSPGRQCRRT